MGAILLQNVGGGQLGVKPI